MKVGLFDSGIGGLTVLKKLIDKYPNNEYIYYGDTKNIPYGDKTINELKMLASNNIDFLLKKEVDMIIIACGTVSSNLTDYLKNKYNIKIVDIISPTINYINNNSYKNIGVIATNSTINSKVFSTNIKKEVTEIACPNFVPFIEKNNITEVKKYFDEYLLPLKKCDLIVLGCTHYPIIKEEINEYFNNEIKLLDMSECINDISNGNKSSINLYFTNLNEITISNINNILKDKTYSINLI